MPRTLPRPRASAVALTALLSLTLAGCASEKSDSGAGSATAAGGEGLTVQTAQFSWTAAGLTNGILSEIAADHPDLGVASLATTQLDPAAAWAGAQRGDIDLLTEVALPNQQELADGAADRVDVVSETYGGAAQGWFVPAYAVAPGGPLAGLTSVTQLDDYAEQLGGKFYDADPGYITTEQNTKRLSGYGIGLEHVVASEAAELAQLKNSYTAQEPIVLYLYHPHAVFAQYDMVQLEEPTPYTDGCLTTGDGACAMPSYSANIAASKELQEQAPGFAGLLTDLRISVEEMEAMQKQVDVDGEDVATVARQWVDGHADQIDQWIA
ncbi:glycine/betaine ABC transporter substrate-binding protein [Modestobacter muralis]|uniref:Glycine/betaine ABC transporter substrate-binding protein n=1 Tax=Modestobacter muralis TaxID=1608614 RepID=A0A6P0ETD3_9ACTN|nr:glycine betaine ABC transporter substrate-binding protein [Modestobacter muralis]NEK94205.1 glycine/betaine ABC transporter substrate-binding protein [Modestobacter muralis]NEN50973.1 glycine/betaine ABC transporter substrate-binding protein [Modestobacter muralis]